MSQNFTDDCFASGHAGQTDLQNMENNFAALKSAFSGASAPSNAVEGMGWIDTTNNIFKRYHDSAWISVWDLDNNCPYGQDFTDGSQLDGDKVDIDWNPTNYTPNASIGEAEDVDDLSAHLKGIDTRLAEMDDLWEKGNIVLAASPKDGNYNEITYQTSWVTLATIRVFIPSGVGTLIGKACIRSNTVQLVYVRIGIDGYYSNDWSTNSNSLVWSSDELSVTGFSSGAWLDLLIQGRTYTTNSMYLDGFTVIGAP